MLYPELIRCIATLASSAKMKISGIILKMFFLSGPGQLSLTVRRHNLNQLQSREKCRNWRVILMMVNIVALLLSVAYNIEHPQCFLSFCFYLPAWQ